MMARSPGRPAVGRGPTPATNVAAIAAVALVVAPFMLGNYWMRVLTTLFMFAALASATNIIAGYTGYPAFGNVVFFGLGAYTTGLLMTKLRAPFWVGVAVGAIICSLYAVVIGI